MGGALGGGASAFMHTFREREIILDLFEELTGCRFHYNHHTVGGNRHDIPVGWDKLGLDALSIIEHRSQEYEGLLLENDVFRARTVGVGVVDPVLAMECDNIGYCAERGEGKGLAHEITEFLREFFRPGEMPAELPDELVGYAYPGKLLEDLLVIA